MIRWYLPAEHLRVKPAYTTGKSLAFMAELMMMLLFFLIAATITAMVFVRAYTVSREATQKQAALLLAENAYEAAKYAADRPETVVSLLGLTGENGVYAKQQDELTLLVAFSESSTPAGKVYTAAIRVENDKGEILSETEATRYVSIHAAGN